MVSVAQELWRWLEWGRWGGVMLQYFGSGLFVV